MIRNRTLMKLLEFTTGFFNAVTVLPLLVVLPVLLWAALWRRERFRSGRKSLYLAGLVSGLVALGLALAGLHWWTHPDLRFPVETLTATNGQAAFQTGGLHPEDRPDLLSQVRAATWQPISLVIVDGRKGEARTAYAFVGQDHGTMYACRGVALHGWEITSSTAWAGDARGYVLGLGAGP